ncbi:MAG: PLP-dependent aminotransferase family protein, partial [Hyphomicrobiaceae bacterium]
SAHIKRARKRVKAARDALVEALREGPFAVSAPEQGLHLVAALAPGADDVSLARRAREAGFGAKALSPLYLAEPARRGLVIGFSGFPPEVMASAARRFLSLVA